MQQKFPWWKLIAASFPWMSIAIWFIPVALGFELGQAELVSSIVLTALGLYFAFRLEEGLERGGIPPSLEGNDLAGLYCSLHHVYWILFPRAG